VRGLVSGTPVLDGGVVMVEMTWLETFRLLGLDVLVLLLLGLAAGDCLEHVRDRLTFRDGQSRH
jgi:hypothetical protein